MEVCGQPHAQASLPPQVNSTLYPLNRRLVNLNAALEKKSSPSPARIQTPGNPAHSLDTIMTMLPWLSHKVVLKSNFKVKGKKVL